MSLAQHISLLLFVCGVSAMSRHPDAPYLLVSCLGTGTPWSERRPGDTFEQFMHETFAEKIPDARPAQEQDSEFSCAHPTRNGANALTKSSSACNFPDNREVGRVICAVRCLWLPANADRVVRPSQKSLNSAKFFVAFRTEKLIEIPPHLGNDRESPNRRRPSDIQECLESSHVTQIQDLLREAITAAEVCLQARKRPRYPNQRDPKVPELLSLSCLRKLVDHLSHSKEHPEECSSTAWTPEGATVFAPSDIILRACTCARMAKFPTHISVDCCGLGPNNVARKTFFDTEQEVSAALLHAEKSIFL